MRVYFFSSLMCCQRNRRGDRVHNTVKDRQSTASVTVILYYNNIPCQYIIAILSE